VKILKLLLFTKITFAFCILMIAENIFVLIWLLKEEPEKYKRIKKIFGFSKGRRFSRSIKTAQGDFCLYNACYEIEATAPNLNGDSHGEQKYTKTAPINGTVRSSEQKKKLRAVNITAT